jgi:hypothetical protein
MLLSIFVSLQNPEIIWKKALSCATIQLSQPEQLPYTPKEIYHR